MWPFDTEEIEGKATADAYSVLYSRVHGGPGVAGLSQTVGSFREQIKGDFANAEQALHDALTRAGATWAGGASDAMQAGLRPMAAFSSDSASAADQMAGTVQTEADGFADAKNGMPEPVTVTATDNALERGAAHLFGNQTDMEEQEAAKEAAEAEGYRVYREYDGTSSGNIGSAAIYPAAPRLAVGASDPGAQGVQVTGPAGTSTQGAGAAPAASVAPPPGGAGGGAGVPPPAAAPGPVPTPGPTPSPGGDGGGAPRTPGQVPGGAPRGGGVGGGVVPTPFPMGGGAAGGSGGDRWRRTMGPGMFDNNPRGTRGGTPGGSARSGAAEAGGKTGAADGKTAERGGAGRAAAATPSEAGRGSSPAAGTRGTAGAAGAPLAAGGARRGEEDKEHQSPDYLVETEDIFGDGRKVAPPVIGEDPPEER